MAYADQWALTKDESFRGRVTMAALNVAQDTIYGNDPDEKRMNLARSIVNSPESAANRFIFYVASNAIISSAGPVNSTDKDIYDIIWSVWDRAAQL